MLNCTPCSVFQTGLLGRLGRSPRQPAELQPLFGTATWSRALPGWSCSVRAAGLYALKRGLVPAVVTAALCTKVREVLESPAAWQPRAMSTNSFVSCEMDNSDTYRKSADLSTFSDGTLQRYVDRLIDTPPTGGTPFRRRQYWRDSADRSLLSSARRAANRSRLSLKSCAARPVPASW